MSAGQTVGGGMIKKLVVTLAALLLMFLAGIFLSFDRAAPERSFWDFYGDSDRWGDDWSEELNSKYWRLDAEKRRLVSIGFHKILEESQRQDLYDLCRIFSGRFCGDDRFSYFVRSIILIGEDFHVGLINEPDLLFSLALERGWGDLGFWVEDLGDLENDDFGAGGVDQFSEVDLLKKSEIELAKEYPRTFAYCYAERCSSDGRKSPVEGESAKND